MKIAAGFAAGAGEYSLWEGCMPETSIDTGRRESIDAVSECSRCIYRLHDGSACVAFPWGIPDEIRRGQVQHTRPYPGDGGFRFVPLQTK